MRTIPFCTLAIDCAIRSSFLTTTVVSLVTVAAAATEAPCDAGAAAAGTTFSTVRSTIWLIVRVTDGGAWSIKETVTMPVAMDVTKPTKKARRTI